MSFIPCSLSIGNFLLGPKGSIIKLIELGCSRIVGLQSIVVSSLCLLKRGKILGILESNLCIVCGLEVLVLLLLCILGSLLGIERIVVKLVKLGSSVISSLLGILEGGFSILDGRQVLSSIEVSLSLIASIASSGPLGVLSLSSIASLQSLVVELIVLATKIISISLKLRILLAKVHQGNSSIPLCLQILGLLGGVLQLAVCLVVCIDGIVVVSLGLIDLSLRISNDALLSINHLA